MKPERINSLTGLRALAMLTIFGSHLNYLAETPFQRLFSLTSNGRFGVNFFLVLSGFVIALGYSKTLNEKNMIRDVKFVKKRISKIYIPYLITMILAIPLYIFQVTFEEGSSLSTKLLIIRLIINSGMLQSAIPLAKYSASINGVSWFISTIFIIYLFTPAIIRLNNKVARQYTLLKLLFLGVVVLFIHCCVYMGIRQIEYIRFADRGLSIIYISPLIRIFPFLLGIIVYNIYRLLGGFQIKNGSFVEILAIVVFFVWWMTADKTGLPTIGTECIDMLISMLVVLAFAFSTRGIISGWLSKEKLLTMGKISLEFYLVHYLIINYGVIAAKHIGVDLGIVALPLIILFFAISLCGAFVIQHFAKWLLLSLRWKKPA